MGDRWVSFDVYGTLVDWDGGIRRELARLWPPADADALLERYHEIEPRVELDGSLAYRDILTQALRLLAEAEGLDLHPGDETALADSLPSWPAFAEAPGELRALRARGVRVALLSNTDPDFLAASTARLGLEPDAAVTAQDAGSYKPAHGHWLTFFRREDVDRGRHAHVAASLFHDLAPCAELGIPAIWINRLGETSTLPRAGELPTLAGLADALDAILPR
ncbi:MAG: HAD family hydrolase [Thermoleophilia bacterium]|nr:HAD family hydrolase [Thermoleophilia bacterium]